MLETFLRLIILDFCLTKGCFVYLFCWKVWSNDSLVHNTSQNTHDTLLSTSWSSIMTGNTTKLDFTTHGYYPTTTELSKSKKKITKTKQEKLKRKKKMSVRSSSTNATETLIRILTDKVFHMNGHLTYDRIIWKRNVKHYDSDLLKLRVTGVKCFSWFRVTCFSIKLINRFGCLWFGSLNIQGKYTMVKSTQCLL